MGNIEFQHVKILIRTGRLKVQGNSKAVENSKSTKCDACDIGKGHHQSNKVNKINNNPTK